MNHANARGRTGGGGSKADEGGGDGGTPQRWVKRQVWKRDTKRDKQENNGGAGGGHPGDLTYNGVIGRNKRDTRE